MKRSERDGFFTEKRQARGENGCSDPIYFKTKQKNSTMAAIIYFLMKALMKEWKNRHYTLPAVPSVILESDSKSEIHIKSFPGTREYLGVTEMSQRHCGDGGTAV